MLKLRLPRPDEADVLTELCVRSKASHGYDEAFMAACRDELTVKLDSPGRRFAVAEENGRLVGMAQISIEGSTAELEKLFVEPSRFGASVGSELFRWAEAEAAAAGADRMVLDSDPYAVGFYRALGAVEAGYSPSGSQPGRLLPRLCLDLAKAGRS